MNQQLQLPIYSQEFLDQALINGGIPAQASITTPMYDERRGCWSDDRRCTKENHEYNLALRAHMGASLDAARTRAAEFAANYRDPVKTAHCVEEPFTTGRSYEPLPTTDQLDNFDPSDDGAPAATTKPSGGGQTKQHCAWNRKRLDLSGRDMAKAHKTAHDVGQTRKGDKRAIARGRARERDTKREDRSMLDGYGFAAADFDYEQRRQRWDDDYCCGYGHWWEDDWSICSRYGGGCWTPPGVNWQTGRRFSDELLDADDAATVDTVDTNEIDVDWFDFDDE